MSSSSSPASTSARRPEPLLPSASLFASVGLVAALLLGCDGGATPTEPVEPEPAPFAEAVAPEGTAVLVDHVPIPVDEVERWAEWIAEVEPEFVSDARRRYALTNGLLERAALTALHGEAREVALERALACAQALEAGGEAPEEGLFRGQVEGSWRELGLHLWGELQPADAARWVGPFERLGAFTLARVRSTSEVRGQQVLDVELLDYPFLDPATAREEVRTCPDRTTLTIVDPAYEALVPEAWKFRMRGLDR